ncbi:hypothetical protein TWF730_002521 [Orbilia blumenaviensis]|uniref:Nucleoside phosphorylase domain-containing protein n=1 Tax=Orbilia blumenaviensis TaxID=1796055 RepID=A0AAV9UAX1_9PEZI
MSNDLRVWIEPKSHSIEGHTAKCSLYFNDRIIWGPRHCHNNTVRLRDALNAADPRFRLDVSPKGKTIEGHTYAISVKAGDRLYLDRLSTHGHMLELCNAIEECLAAERRKVSQNTPNPVPELPPPSQAPRPSPPRHQPGPSETPPPVSSPHHPPTPPESPNSKASTRPSSRHGFEIAIICALRVEHDAVEAFLDEEFEIDGFSYGKAPGDYNAYTTGRIGSKPVVLAYMPNMGKAAAAVVSSQLHMSFTRLKVVFLVGICGAAPMDSRDRQTFLGDIMISTAVIQFDFGRQYADGFIRKNTLEDNLGRANPEIRSFLQKLEGKSTTKRLELKTLQYVTDLWTRDDEYVYPADDGNDDNLYSAEYRHKHQDSSFCSICAKCRLPNDPVCDIAKESSCAVLGCSAEHLVKRKARKFTGPCFHFGRFASGDSVMKCGIYRDKIVAKEKVIAFEMEGAGSWDSIPTVIMKGACDYADSHKNKAWQRYAAATAAAGMKAVMEEWRSSS